MTITLQEALANGHKWAAKYAPQPKVVIQPPKQPGVPGRPRVANPKSEQQRMRERIERTSAMKAEKRRKLHPKMISALSSGNWTRMKDVVAAMGVNTQQCLRVAEDLQELEQIAMTRHHEATWLTMWVNREQPLPEDAEYFTKRNALRKKNKLQQMERMNRAKARTTEWIRSIGREAGEAPEVWRTPQ